MLATDIDSATASAAAAGGAEKRAYVKKIFSEIAPRYDLLNHVLSLNIDRQWRRKAIAGLNIDRNPTGPYLDLCAGTLDVSAMLSTTRGFRGLVIGADFAEPMLAAGVDKVERSKVAPVAADAVELPIGSGKLAGAIVAFGIRNVAGLDQALREAYRVLAPQGRLVILEFSTPRARVAQITLYVLLQSRAATDRQARKRSSHSIHVSAALGRELPRRRGAREEDGGCRIHPGDAGRASHSASRQSTLASGQHRERMSLDNISQFLRRSIARASWSASPSR